MKPGVAWWALQQSVSLSPIKLICPAPYDCAPPAVSFLREIALALNYTNLNISSCPFSHCFSAVSDALCRFLKNHTWISALLWDNYSVHECCMNKGGCWAWWSKALRVQDLRLSANPLKEEIIKCCYKSHWPTQDSIFLFIKSLFSTPSRLAGV